MEQDNGLANKKSLLASIIYIKSEANREGLKKTQIALENVLDSYFEDVNDKGYENFSDELMLVRNILDKASKMEKTDLKTFINLSYLFETDSEKETYN